MSYPALRRAPFAAVLALLCILGLALRVGFVLLEPRVDPVVDEGMWLTWGVGILPSDDVSFGPVAFRYIFHPPLYLYFLGASHTYLGGYLGIRLAQAVLGSLAVVAVGLLGRRAFGSAAGLVAAVSTAAYPELVWFTSHYWAETVFVSILAWALDRTGAAGVSGRPRTAFVAGVLFGLAVLTRETVLYFIPVAAVWLAWPERPGGRPFGWRPAGAFLLASVLVVAPWTYRNWVVYRAFVPVSTAGALNLFQGNARLTRQEVYERYAAVRGRIAKYQFARKAGLQAVWGRQPSWLLEKLRDEMPNFWEADSQALVHVRRGFYGPVRPAAAVLVTVLVVGSYLGALILSAIGLARMPLRRVPVLLALFLLYYVAIHVATHGYARYRLPVMPVLFVFAGAAVAGGGALAAARSRRMALTGIASVLGLSLAPSLSYLTRLETVVSENARFGLPEGPSPDQAEEGEP